MRKTLYDLKINETGVVKEIAAQENMRIRLQELGVVRGTGIECYNRSPLGDPTAYIIRGAVIALRKEDAACVMLN